ncbi:hypothetical protein GP486_000616 [Trichoglossum hirsutum]|uniref:Catechol dioxygenase n=1 Tax=Trichoglossum hirsutum TaxID=265104 RepID=A0A9P8LIP6_9PEZI|nr:hypothetical protein GP486_000616 [Trichoglossum hirsutum]
MSSSAPTTDYAQQAISAMGPNINPRLRTVVTSLIRHLHAFARETSLTTDEWLAGVEMINAAGRMSVPGKRNEGRLLCDVIGLESLIDGLAHTTANASATESSLLGPYYRPDAPVLPSNSSIIHNPAPPADGIVAYLYGRVYNSVTGAPVTDATLDLWQASTNGLYEHEDKEQVDYNLRGKICVDGEGNYGVYCLKPTAYSIPNDGVAGDLLRLLDRDPMRPGHIHIVAKHPSYKTLITQIFDRGDKYVSHDPVFAVRDSLVVDFVERKGDPKAAVETKFDIGLVPA